ncbi:MAG: acetyl-CoA carboxylase biotin carboxyl carrier protein subunit [Balneolaceae bacterium]|nr:acetyl-CoA carboxylase biotin carboxyl carrier protein subunit [Balneolaceae bacterium]
MKFEASVNDNTHELELDEDNSTVIFGDDSQDYSFHRQKNGRYLLRVGTKLYKIDNVSYEKHTIAFSMNGNWCEVDVRDERDLLLDKLGFKTSAELGEGQLNAPMPGKILEIMVKEGDEVEADDPVVILEAMKMENELKAPVSGIVTTIAAETGDSLEKNALILEIEASG